MSEGMTPATNHGSIGHSAEVASLRCPTERSTDASPSPPTRATSTAEDDVEEAVESREEGSSSCVRFLWSPRVLLGLILLSLIGYVIVDTATGTGNVRQGVEAFLQWIEDYPAWGFFGLVLGTKHSRQGLR
jgi:hypothetical protein